MYASKCENVHLLIDMTSLQTILLNPKQAQINNSLLTCEPAGTRLQGLPGGYCVILLVVHPALYHASLCIFSIKFLL